MEAAQPRRQPERITHGFTLSQMDALELISARLRAMLEMVNCSGGLQSLDELSEELRSDYLMACADMARDLREIIRESRSLSPVRTSI